MNKSTQDETQFAFFLVVMVIAVPIWLLNETAKAIIAFANHPEVRLFISIYKEVLVENYRDIKETIQYTYHNLRCYTQNIFVSEEVITLDYFNRGE